MEQHVSAVGVPKTLSAAALKTERNRADDTQTPGRPYLKVFGSDIGVLEIELTGKPLTIGRLEDADIRLPDPRVSRLHARIECSDGRYTITDANSTCGTMVNGGRIASHELSHGDSVQIANYLLQFRTHTTLPGAAIAAQRAKRLLQADFCTLPSTMRLQHRTLALGPRQVFAAGDTLKIGQGGLLVPTMQPPDEGACLELQLSMANHASRRYLGEIIGVIEEDNTHWMCVKLHTLARDAHEAVVAGAEPGPWNDVDAT